MKIAAGEFKAKCLKLMDEVQESNMEIIITKYGKPVAKLVPFKNKTSKSLFGYLKNTIIINDDIISPVGEKWDVEK